MSRFYRLDVQPTLFGEWAVVREWGRIGSHGRVRIVSCPTEAAAIAALGKQRQAKERRRVCANSLTLPNYFDNKL